MTDILVHAKQVLKNKIISVNVNLHGLHQLYDLAPSTGEINKEHIYYNVHHHLLISKCN